MKLVPPALLLLVMTTPACNKPGENNNGGGGTVERIWKVGGTAHTVNNYAQSGEIYSAYDADGNSIHFSFASYPPAAGSYRVVNKAATLGAGQVNVSTASFASLSDTYNATGSDAVNATVSFENGRIKIVLPDAWAKATAGSDSLKLSATLSPLQ